MEENEGGGSGRADASGTEADPAQRLEGGLEQGVAAFGRGPGGRVQRVVGTARAEASVLRAGVEVGSPGSPRRSSTAGLTPAPSAPTRRSSSSTGSSGPDRPAGVPRRRTSPRDRKSTRLNSSHANISYAVFCLKKK